MAAWFNKRRTRLMGDFPCERCDEPSTGPFSAEWEPYVWWPEDMENIVLEPQNHNDAFRNIYPRPLMLCPRCSVAHHFWFNRRKFFFEYKLGKRILMDARAAGVFKTCQPLQLVGTPAFIGAHEEHLALADVARASMDIGSRIITKTAFAEHRMQLRDMVAWLKLWHEDHPWDPKIRDHR